MVSTGCPLTILDVADDMVDGLVGRLDALGLPSLPSHWRKNLIACTGIEFCKLSFAETRKPVPGAGARAGAAARGHQRSTGRADHDQHQPGSGRPENRCPERANPLPGTS